MPLSPQTLFERYSPAMARLQVHDEHGDPSSGSEFHLGDGVFATAKHVVEGKRDFSLLLEGFGELEISGTFASDTEDIAVVTTSGLPPPAFVPLGSHLDDWISDAAFYLAVGGSLNLAFDAHRNSRS